MTNPAPHQPWPLAVQIVEEQTLQRWNRAAPGRQPNPFDPRLGCAAALAHCRTLSHLYAGKANQIGGSRLAQHVHDNLPSVVATLRADRDRVLRSNLFCVEAPSPTTAIAHHCASGLQVRAHAAPLHDPVFAQSVVSQPHVGSYLSFPCRNPAAAARKDIGLWWARYIWLGIGERVYRRADDMLGGMRWRMGTTSPESKPLRRKLHRADPHKWQDLWCLVCKDHKIDWETTGPGGFPPHP